VKVLAGKVTKISYEITVPEVSAGTKFYNTANDKSTPEIEVVKQNLIFTKTATTANGDNEVLPGELVIYTVTVANSGDGKATNVLVTDNLNAIVNRAGNPVLNLTTVSVSAPGTVSNGIVSVTIPEILPGASSVITITVAMLDPYAPGTIAGEAIVNIVTVDGVTPECPVDINGNPSEGFDPEKCGPIIIPEEKPLFLRNDVFTIANIGDFDPLNLPTAAEKNAIPQVVTAGQAVFYFITLTNDNPTVVKVPNVKKTVTSDYADLKDSLGKLAFTEFEFEGIIFKNNKTDAIKFLNTANLEELVDFLTENNFPGTVLGTNNFNFTTVLPNSSLTFVVKARLNPEGVFLPTTPVAKA
ncbi:MAG: hypothetical protein ACRC6B_06175, partial [Fusobacteriaceae bacterium]